MTDFSTSSNENHDFEIIASSGEYNLNSLLSDEVVMQWLMDLDTEDQANCSD